MAIDPAQFQPARAAGVDNSPLKRDIVQAVANMRQN